jgi:hypothetical protein
LAGLHRCRLSKGDPRVSYTHQAAAGRSNFRFKFQTANFQTEKETSWHGSFETSVLFPRRHAPESLKHFPPTGLVRPQGRAGCRVPDAPAALCAKKGRTSAHKYSQRRHRKTRPSRTRWWCCLCRALLGEVLYCARPPTEDGLSAPGWADEPPQELPQLQGRDHTVYQSAASAVRLAQPYHQLTSPSLMGMPCQFMATRDTAASIASHSASVTIAIRPSCGTRRINYKIF